MLIKHPPEIRSSEVTPPALYFGRRRFLQAGVAAAVGALAPVSGWAAKLDTAGFAHLKRPSPYDTKDELTPYSDVTGYNNFYEFGTSKSDPAEYAPKYLKPQPWSVAIEGHCEKPGTYSVEDFVKPYTLEERVYRFRCVEAWSMVVPWVGFPLAAMLKQFQPTSQAKYVEFHTLLDPKQMPGENTSILDWPYTEGLRMDEAMNPLTLLVVGVYGKILPNQNGAPLRLIVPWKYGFKSIKSIVKIRFTEKQPLNSWQQEAPNEYGFYANVNPAVPHPRWSQARERRLGHFFKQPTLPFNGYGHYVAQLYAGMDPKKLY